MGEGSGRADLWLAGQSTEPEIILAGIPWAPFTPGVALAPMALRNRLHRFSTFHSERTTDFSAVAVTDLGNWPVTGLDDAALAEYLAERLPRLPDSQLELFVGGESDITTPILLARPTDRTKGLIRFSCRPLESHRDLGAHEVVLIGLHTFAASTEAVATSKEAGAIAITNDRISKEGTRMTIDRALGQLSMSEAIHVSVDVDALDRSQAPGSTSSVPGGLTIRQLSEAVRRCGANRKVRSFDFVGADTDSDISSLTIDALCHLVLSAVAGYAERSAS